jgi:hypothetical protein
MNLFYLMQKKTTALTGQTSNAMPPAISAGPSGVFGGLLLYKRKTIHSKVLR